MDTSLSGATADRVLETAPGGGVPRRLRVLIRWARFARSHRAAAVAGVVGFSLALSVAASLVLSHPEPLVHDEFSYLLAADTFAHGRLVNAQHPLWPFFEAPHVIVHPVYASKYPPAQGMFLALGQSVFHDPAAGVFLSVALFAGAVCWALQAYVSPPWALLGGLFSAIAFGPGHYWTQSYWGGAVAALGAALAIGASRRIVLLRRPAYGWIYGVGALILLNSRPFEGGALLACLSASLLWHAFRRRRFGLLVPAALAVLLAAALLAWYNYRVTGNPLELPYAEYQAQYGPAPTIWIAPARLAAHYGYPQLRRLFEHFLTERSTILEWPLSTRLLALTWRLGNVLSISPGSGFLVTFLFLPVALRRRAAKELALAAAVAACACLLDVSLLLHYAGPLIVLLIVLSFVIVHRVARQRGRQRAAAACISAILVVSMFASPCRMLGRALMKIDDTVRPSPNRDQIASRIRQHGGYHVVLVRYRPDHNINVEWVYNGADIDAAPVIWAHDLGDERNRALIAHYPQRQFWLFEPDLQKADPRPYSLP